MISTLPRPQDPRLLVGTETADDAAVYRLGDDLALVLTVDFITPILDDPRAFGMVAAANSLSDVYAMGGRPLAALNVVCFPDGELPLDVLGEILRGGHDKCAEAGCLVVGGHTVSDPELKYGLSVTGTVRPDRVVKNGGARPGDALVLTKPLGTGVLATALKRGKLPAPELAALTASMGELNAAAAEAMLAASVHAATDVTGFGLLGHALEVATASAAVLELEASRLPLLPGARELAARGHLTAGDRRNREYVGQALRLEGRVADDLLALAFDAQTSGGLLAAVPAETADAMLARLPRAARVGRVLAGPPGLVLRA